MHNLPKRFSDKVEFTDGCWLWTAYKNNSGYGVYSFKGKTILAHRFAWSQTKGEIRNKLLVLHKCDVPTCVNPDHLFLGTDQDNMKDRDSKGRVGHPVGEKNGRAKLTKEQIEEIRRTYRRGEKGEFSQGGLAKKYGVMQAHIGNIVNNKAWGLNKKKAEEPKHA